MASQMVMFICEHIYYFTAFLYLTVATVCLLSKSNDAMALSATLGILIIVTWAPAIWENQLLMSFVHLSILLVMLLTLYGKYSPTLIGLVFISLSLDALWLALPTLNLKFNNLAALSDIIWWHMSLNTLFSAMCLAALARCYNIHVSAEKSTFDKFYSRSVEIGRGMVSKW